MLFASSLDMSPRVTSLFPAVEFARFNQDDFDSPMTRELLARADAVYAGQGFFTAEVLAGLTRVKWLQVPSAGFESIDLKMVRERQIIFTNGRGVYSVPIAEDVICKMICLARHYPRVFEQQDRALWGGVPAASELRGKVAGLLGTGSIAGEIALRARAFGMRTLGYNTSGRPVEYFDEVVQGQGGLARVLSESDYVIVTVPLSEGTRGLVGGDGFRVMKPTAYIINIARGLVVDEQELIAALREGRIAGAGLDVFEREPLPKDSPLWAMPNVIITPHNSGTGDGVRARLEALLTTNLRTFPDTSKMVNVISMS